MANAAALQMLVDRAASWPEDAREELTKVAAEIEAELQAGSYRASEDELIGIDRGLREAAAGGFASTSDVEAVFARNRRR